MFYVIADWMLFVPCTTIFNNIPLLLKNGMTESFEAYTKTFKIFKNNTTLKLVIYALSLIIKVIKIVWFNFSALQIKVKSWVETKLCYALLKHESLCETAKAMMHFRTNKPSYWHDIKDTKHWTQIGITMRTLQHHRQEYIDVEI